MIVDLIEAKKLLKINHDDNDELLTLCIEAKSAEFLAKIGKNKDELGWTESVPADVKLAFLYILESDEKVNAIQAPKKSIKSYKLGQKSVTYDTSEQESRSKAKQEAIEGVFKRYGVAQSKTGKVLHNLYLSN